MRLWCDVLRRQRLSSTAKLVYAVLADRLGDNGACWPGQRRIARDCGMTPKAANRAVAELRRAGLVTIEPGKLTGPRSERTCRYRPADVPESNTLNVLESTTLANGERYRVEHVNVVESNTSTLPNRQQNQTKKPDQETRPKGKAPDTLTHDAVKLWCDTYAECRGDKPDRPDGRAVGMLRRLAHEKAGGSLDVLRPRLRLAAGLDGRAPPWPFDKPGELTIGNVAKHWDKLGDALKVGSDGHDRQGHSSTGGATGTGRGPSRAVPKLDEPITVREYIG